MDKNLKKYFDKIVQEYPVLGIFHHGSCVEGLDDKYSDSDFIVICEKERPDAVWREKLLRKMKGDIHEIKDVHVINTNFDMFEIDNKLVNIAYVLKEGLLEKIDDVIVKEKWDEEVLMFLRNLSLGNTIYEKEKFISILKKKYSKILPKMKERIEAKCIKEVGWYWKKMEISFMRGDILDFIEAMLKILRFVQIKEYMMIGKYPPSMKKFGVRGNKYGLKKLDAIEKVLDKNIRIDGVYRYLDVFLKKEGYRKSMKMRG